LLNKIKISYELLIFMYKLECEQNQQK
jgi:hypothetical protein